jgi:hypothetical protein
MEEKPISLALKEARENLIDAVNAQGLPPTLMKYVVKEVLDMTIQASETELNLMCTFKAPEIKTFTKGEEDDL